MSNKEKGNHGESDYARGPRAVASFALPLTTPPLGLDLKRAVEAAVSAREGEGRAVRARGHTEKDRARGRGEKKTQ